jgi:hypothetical protein
LLFIKTVGTFYVKIEMKYEIMEKEANNKKQMPIEAELALCEVMQKGTETQKKSNNLRKIKIYATVIVTITTFCAANIFINLNWSSDVSAKILEIGLMGWFIILFSESIGKYKGTLWFYGRIGTNITEESPASVLRLLGWIFIFLPIAIALLCLINR